MKKGKKSLIGKRKPTESEVAYAKTLQPLARDALGRVCGACQSGKRHKSSKLLKPHKHNLLVDIDCACWCSTGLKHPEKRAKSQRKQATRKG